MAPDYLSVSPFPDYRARRCPLDDITPTNYLLSPYLSADAGPVLLLVLLTSA